MCAPLSRGRKRNTRLDRGRRCYFDASFVRLKVSEDNKIMGVVTEGNLMACLLSGRVQPEDVVTSAMYKQFKKVRMLV